MTRRNLILWLIAGLTVFAVWVAISRMSFSFVYGEGHAERPILPFIALYAIGWIVFVVGGILALRQETGPRVALWIVAIGVAARAALLPSNLIQEIDCYRYALDGNVLLHGVNPFAWSPAELPENAPPDLQEALSTHEGKALHRVVSYKHVPTIYPPLAQGAFAMGAAVTPWDWRGQRYVFVAVDLAVMGLIVLLLWRTGRPLAWVAFYAWNPLVLKEIANAAHLDSLTALCFVALCLCLYSWAQRERPLWAALSGVALAGAVLTKLFPIILLPVCLAFLLRGQTRWKSISLFVGALGITIVVAYLPFINVGFAQLTEGLRTYSSEWRRNEGAFGVIQWLLAQPPLADWLANVPDKPAPARVISAAIWAAAAVMSAAALYLYGEDEDDVFWAMQTTLLGWFLFLPAAYPWYTVGLLALCALRPKPWAFVLSGVFVLYYLHFYIDYHDLPYHYKKWINAIQHGAVWIALVVPLLVRFIPRRKPDTEPVNA
jgi:hypothetical protein